MDQTITMALISSACWILQWCHGIARGSNANSFTTALPPFNNLQWCHGIARGSNGEIVTVNSSGSVPSMVPRDRPWIKPLNSSKVENVEHRLLQWCHGIARGSNGMGTPQATQHHAPSMVPRDRPWIKQYRVYEDPSDRPLQWCHGIARGSNKNEGKIFVQGDNLQWCHGIARGSNELHKTVPSGLGLLQWCHGIARGSNVKLCGCRANRAKPSMVPRDRPWIKP